MRQVIFIIIISSSFTTIAQTYDRQAATDYANYWWDGRNTMNGEKSVFIFNYESPSCNGYDGSQSQSIAGANLKAT
ncbi:MAG: hypothetical protein PHI54_08720, partial [Bacteroidales bacterium]|nr:hypothetical protein [Bacteroidales bacterium]